MAEYRLSSEAEQDLRLIFRYTLKHFGEAQAMAYQDSILQSAKTAANFSAIGKKHITKEGDELRRYNIGQHAIFYQEQEDEIRIVRILHQQMDMDRHLGTFTGN